MASVVSANLEQKQRNVVRVPVGAVTLLRNASTPASDEKGDHSQFNTASASVGSDVKASTTSAAVPNPKRASGKLVFKPIVPVGNTPAAAANGVTSTQLASKLSHSISASGTGVSTVLVGAQGDATGNSHTIPSALKRSKKSNGDDTAGAEDADRSVHRTLDRRVTFNGNFQSALQAQREVDPDTSKPSDPSVSATRGAASTVETVSQVQFKESTSKVTLVRGDSKLALTQSAAPARKAKSNIDMHQALHTVRWSGRSEAWIMKCT